TRNCTRKYPFAESGICGQDCGYRVLRQKKCRGLARVRGCFFQALSSGTGVLIEPLDCAFPSGIGGSLVVAFRRCVTVEAVNGVRIDVAFAGNVVLLEFRFISWPGHGEPRVECPMMRQNGRFDLWNICKRRIAAVERCNRR